jgi:hypothetical protein
MTKFNSVYKDFGGFDQMMDLWLDYDLLYYDDLANKLWWEESECY